MTRAFLIAALVCSAANAQTIGGCSSTPITCGQTVRGHVAAGGCPNLYTFPGVAKQDVQAVAYPLTPSMGGVTLSLGAFDTSSRAPVVSAGKGAQLEYVLPSGGNWVLAVAATDPAASGDYALNFSCRGTNILASNRQACTKQWLVCGETMEWSLSENDSCRFFTDLNTAYEFFAIYGNAGDTVVVDVEAADYSPKINVYPGNEGGFPIFRSTTLSPTKDTIAFTLPHTGQFDLAVSSHPQRAFGRFKLTVHECASAGCLQPVISPEPQDLVVPYGSTAKLTVTALALGPLRYLWSDRTALPVPLTEGQTFTTPRITQPQSFGVSVTAPCGTAESRVVTVRPAAARERPARH